MKTAVLPPREQSVLILTETASGNEAVQTYLQNQGFEVESLSLEDAPNWLSLILERPPGAVVLDYQLATHQGCHVLQVLKENPHTQAIPVLFYSLTQDEESGSLLVLDYLTKPIGAPQLGEAVSRQLEHEDAPTILIVDDEPGVLEMHARIVRGGVENGRILKATNGKEALVIINQEKPDLVLLDLNMPEMDGFAVLEAMQSEPQTRTIPVIVLTGQTLTEAEMSRLNQGVAVVLGKGLFSAEETFAQIQAALVCQKRLGSEQQRIIRKAIAYIHQQFDQPITVNEIANQIGLSESHLSRTFRD